MTKTPEEIVTKARGEELNRSDDRKDDHIWDSEHFENRIAELGIDQGRAEGRATLAKELLERHNKIANFKLGQTLPNWAVEIVGRETAKAVKAEVKEVQISESRNGQDDAPAADISEEDAENLAKLAVIGELKKLGVIKKEATKTK